MSYSVLTSLLKERLRPFEAFYIHGSRGVRRHVATSDIDYTVLIQKESERKKVYDAVSHILRFDKVPGFFGTREWEVCEWRGLPVGWHIYRTDFLDNLVNDIFTSKDNLFELQDLAQFLIMEAKPVLDSGALLSQWKEQLQRYPQRLSDEIVSDRLERLDAKLKWMGRPYRNPFHFIENMYQITFFIAQAHYARNKAFLMNSMKRWHQDIEHFRPDLKCDLAELVRITETLPEEEKGVILRRIIDKLRL